MFIKESSKRINKLFHSAITEEFYFHAKANTKFMVIIQI